MDPLQVYINDYDKFIDLYELFARVKKKIICVITDPKIK